MGWLVSDPIRTVAFLVVAITALLFNGCREAASLLGWSTVNEFQYADVGEAARDGGMEKFWLPPCLPMDAGVVSVRMSVDSGWVVGMVRVSRFSRSEVALLRTAVARYPRSRLLPEWWDRQLLEKSSRGGDLAEMLTCGQGPGLFYLIEAGREEVYFWNEAAATPG